MKVKRILIFVLVILIISVLYTINTFSEKPELELGIADVNDIVLSVEQNWNNIIEHKVLLPGYEYNLDYAIIDNNGNLLAATRRGITEDLSTALRHRDAVIDIVIDNKTVGKAIFYNASAEVLEASRSRLLKGAIRLICLLAVFCAAYAVYLYNVFFKPFHKLNSFAVNVAAGNLDIPIAMDKDNLFGPFSESFDLMREELVRAKENERAANISKKELVASLSHDIKTPLASIKAVSELMSVRMENEADKKQLDMISVKIDQINLLITNMFNATVEELKELQVNASEVPSTVLVQMLNNADYQGRADIKEIPQCILTADCLRLQQVFDNIINNSYKYAQTDIQVDSYFENEYLVISIMDHGPGVLEEDFPLIFRKFYRGKNAEGKSGAGLGLYISKYLIERMGGKIDSVNRAEGFTVRIYLGLAGRIKE